jgi:hypothetical protein
MRFTLDRTSIEAQVKVSLQDSENQGVLVCLDGIPIINFAKEGVWRLYMRRSDEERLRSLGVKFEHLHSRFGTSPGSENVIAIDPEKSK